MSASLSRRSGPRCQAAEESFRNEVEHRGGSKDDQLATIRQVPQTVPRNMRQEKWDGKNDAGPDLGKGRSPRLRLTVLCPSLQITISKPGPRRKDSPSAPIWNQTKFGCCGPFLIRESSWSVSPRAPCCDVQQKLRDTMTRFPTRPGHVHWKMISVEKRPIVASCKGCELNSKQHDNQGHNPPSKQRNAARP
ncbi:uncharacterized protein LY79DRAFT_676610 [Colletotrichum navitas]|uniref:Uncharacterized protein n=1 Tax=Colletotrichum navitas TaxID=681940 RepID=A0AAD8VAP6_9PEZI|nr:uncharacterized protein LY79DRAFT_676610 [Colletotrichum navitas]KAK1600587.1 hypothetical protein LY79DRAFT_676610 [Colletotrichum navitas]